MKPLPNKSSLNSDLIDKMGTDSRLKFRGLSLDN